MKLSRLATRSSGPQTHGCPLSRRRFQARQVSKANGCDVEPQHPAPPNKLSETVRELSTVGFTVLALFSFSPRGHAQGSLTPPGPPGPMMKTLAQIEPRTPISSLPFIVTTPGAYYLTTNLVGRAAADGIAILADNVSLDLGGFSLTGVSDALKGISVVGARQNVSIRNGSISNWRTGIDAASVNFGSFESLLISNNGGTGLVAGVSATISQCASYSNEGDGIQMDRDGFIRDCTVRNNSMNGLRIGNGSQVQACRASYNTLHGIRLDSNCQVTHCTALNNTANGFMGTQGNQIAFCMASNNGGHGFQMDKNAALDHCSALANAGAGIVVNDSSQLSFCLASNNQSEGVLGTTDLMIAQCSASNNREHGIVAGEFSSITLCKALANGKTGIRADTGSMVRQCTTQRNNGDGIFVTARCTVVANNCNHNFNVRDAAGIHAGGADNCLKDNNVVANDRGISVDAAGNIVLRNTSANNTINYYLIGTQMTGPLFNGPNMEQATNPWSNFEY